ncbi:MAG: hypothetical protein U9N73_12940 [Candidatus Auribacterota bacterium]|nr:hypothetical protein [Candidatus Auribacterota bacterium]
MPIIEYPFKKLTPADPLRPILPIRITNPDTGLSLRSWGLIDTGADDCAFPAGMATILGHNLSAGTPKQIGTGNGVTIAYAHTCKIEIFKIEPDGNVSDEEVVYKIDNTPLDFMPNLESLLLGVQNFLNNFILTIDYPNKSFSVCHPTM